MKKNYVTPNTICVDLKGENICVVSGQSFNTDSTPLLENAELDAKERISDVLDSFDWEQ